MTVSDTTSGASPQQPKRTTLIFLLSIAFLNTAGISMFLPILPFITQQYVPDHNNLAITVGWLGSVYAICQFLAAPTLGALSDRYGRRPVLLFCLLGSAIGYALFGFGGALWVLFLGRIIDGITGGNFSILSAYIADLTAPEERSTYFGLFGAIAGAGFIAGPAIGGFISKIDYSAPAYFAAGIVFVSLLWGVFFLPESLGAEHRATQISLRDLNIVKQLGNAFALVQLRWLLVTTFCFSLAAAMAQAIMAVLIIDTLHWNADSISYVFLLIGVMDVVMQGLLARRLLAIFSEITLTVAGLACEIIAYVLLGSVAFIASPVPIILGIIMLATGTGFLEPAFRGLVSRAAGPRQQGVVQGGNQSMQSLAMVVGPLLGGVLYIQVGKPAPLWIGAGVVALAILTALLAVPSIRAHQEAASAA